MRALLVTESTDSNEALRQVVLATGLECAPVDTVSFGGLTDRLKLENPDLALVVLSGPNDAALAAVRSLADQGVPVLIAGPNHDPALILQTLRHGACEYLDHNSLAAELPAALEKMRLAGAIRVKRGRVLAVTAVNPGSGVTTVACGLGFALAASHPGQVVVAELGAEVPELAITLDLEPKNDLGQLLKDWPRMDASMVRQVVMEHPGGAHVLAYALQPLLVPRPEPAALRPTVNLLRGIYDFSVIDLGFAAFPGALEVMRLADAVVVVTRLDIPSLRLSRAYIRQLVNAGLPAENLKPVANRYGQSKQLPWKQAQETLGLPVLEWIPEDSGAMNVASTKGQPLVVSARGAKITKRFAQLAHQLNGQVS